MNANPLKLPGLMTLTPSRSSDPRGYFLETYNENVFAKHGVAAKFVQDNQSLSLAKGTIRGLHFQLPPHAQAKLVRVVQGSIFDVAVDLRMGSETYGQSATATLTAAGNEQIFVPRGFAHGFCTLEPNTLVAYKVDDFYARHSESGLIWNDPTLAIQWPVAASEIVLSDNDRKHGRFADFKSPFKYEGP